MAVGRSAHRVAVVTGAGRGIGRATALALARRGHRVMAVSRTEADLAPLAAHPNVEVLVESVATVEGCETIIEAARHVLGSVDILISNAGIGSYHEAEIWQQSIDVWNESLAINLSATFYLMRFAAPHMIEAGWGRIVTVSSTAANVGAPSNSAYSAAKAGVLGLMRAAAQDLIPHGVTCNAVLPGWVKTDMADADAAVEAERRGLTIDEIWSARAAGYAAGRVLMPAEIAEVICFLASDAASGVNGEAMTVSLGSVW